MQTKKSIVVRCRNNKKFNPLRHCLLYYNTYSVKIDTYGQNCGGKIIQQFWILLVDRNYFCIMKCFLHRKTSNYSLLSFLDRNYFLLSFLAGNYLLLSFLDRNFIICNKCAWICQKHCNSRLKCVNLANYLNSQQKCVIFVK